MEDVMSSCDNPPFSCLNFLIEKSGVHVTIERDLNAAVDTWCVEPSDDPTGLLVKLCCILKPDADVDAPGDQVYNNSFDSIGVYQCRDLRNSMVKCLVRLCLSLHLYHQKFLEFVPKLDEDLLIKVVGKMRPLNAYEYAWYIQEKVKQVKTGDLEEHFSFAAYNLMMPLQYGAKVHKELWSAPEDQAIICIILLYKLKSKRRRFIMSNFKYEKILATLLQNHESVVRCFASLGCPLSVAAYEAHVLPEIRKTLRYNYRGNGINKFKKFSDTLFEILEEPLTLQEWCRIVIRSNITAPIPFVKAIGALGLPVPLQEFLRMSEFFELV